MLNRRRPLGSGPATAGKRELVCVESGARSHDGAGWKADVVTDDEGIDEDEVDVWCPECWAREFGRANS